MVGISTALSIYHLNIFIKLLSFYSETVIRYSKILRYNYSIFCFSSLTFCALIFKQCSHGTRWLAPIIKSCTPSKAIRPYLHSSGKSYEILILHQLNIQAVDRKLQRYLGVKLPWVRTYVERAKVKRSQDQEIPQYRNFCHKNWQA